MVTVYDARVTDNSYSEQGIRIMPIVGNYMCIIWDEEVVSGPSILSYYSVCMY